MFNAKVILAYMLFVVLVAIVPGLISEHWIGYAAGAAVAGAWWLIASVAGDAILLKTIKAEPLNVVTYGEIAKAVTSKRLGPKTGVPSLWMVGNISPMLMSIGLNSKRSHLVFTRGFLQGMDDKVHLATIMRELEAIRSGRTAARTAAATLLWIIILPGRLANWATGKEPGEPTALSVILNLVPAFVAAFFVVLTSDKATVYDVDRNVQKQLDNPDYLPYAFLKLQEAALALPYNVDLALTPCCIINPNSKDPFSNLFKPHPPTPKRMERLRPSRGNSLRR